MALGGTCLFCDDIRFEQQNKFTLVGCYGPDLIISDRLPVILPKLCVLIDMRFPPERLPLIKVTVTIPGQVDPFFSHVQEPEAEEFVSSLNTDDPDVEPLRGGIIPAIFSPFAVQTFGFVKVRMDYGSEKIRLGALHIRPPDPVASRAQR